jgi:signal transduction histidine kinase
MILNHLLDNALKFTHKGEVAIKVSAICGADREVFLSVQVKDTGKGIPKSSLSGLGNPFYSLRENGWYGSHEFAILTRTHFLNFYF